MAGSAKRTTDHNEIKRWVEQHGGVPTSITQTEKGGKPGVLRIHFPKNSQADESKFDELSWDEFFKAFDENDLAFLYQEGDSTFHKFVARSGGED